MIDIEFELAGHSGNIVKHPVTARDQRLEGLAHRALAQVTQPVVAIPGKCPHDEPPREK